MITPAGAECALYYEDFARGARMQQCRAAKHPRSAEWRQEDCGSCPVPRILTANGSPALELRLIIRPGVLGIGRHVEIDAWCSAHGPIAGDPCIGCKACNAEADELLKRALE
ncbi:MAG: hypothetical protein EG823_02170 [Actinobacteria bacterium]|nr:hypothetical protein [Actinomycetota bacterium]